jgi:hypothetical protein
MAEQSGVRRTRGGLIAAVTIACFLLVLGALALPGTPTERLRKPAPPTLIIRRVVYRTTVVEELVPPGGAARPASTSVSRSAPVISAPTPVAAPGPVTRTS